MSSTAQKLLSAPTQVHSVGPRPASVRKIVNFLLFTSFWTGLGLAGSHLAQNAFSIPRSSLYAPISAVDLAPVNLSGTPHTISHESPWLSAMYTGASTKISVPSVSSFDHFQDVSLDESISFDAAKNLFEQLNLSPDQALEVYLNLQHATDAYVVSGAISNPQDVLPNQQQKSLDWLNEVWDKGDNDWSDISSPQLSAGFISTNAQWSNASDDEKWIMIQTLWNRRMVSSLFKVENMVTTDLDVEGAQQYLQQTVDEVGLAGLVVPFMIKDDPSMLISLAQQLQQANQEMQRTTGLKGKVLGLNHRVILDNSNMDETAYVNNNDHGYIRMFSAWDSFSHEWYHSFDLSVRQAYIRTKSDHAWNVLKAIEHAWGGIENPSLSSEDRHAIEEEVSSVPKLRIPSNLEPHQKALIVSDNNVIDGGVPDTGSPWLHWRHNAVREIKWHDHKAWFTQTPREIYFSSRYELMAFAFEGYHHLHQQKGKNNVSFAAHFYYSPSYQPTPIESAAQKNTWVELFSASQQWWQEDQLERAPEHPSLLSGDLIKNKRVAVEEKPKAFSL